MANKGFPSFGMTQAGAFVASLKNYNLPDLILKLIAKDCESDLLERGRIDDRLLSMNDKALELLHRVFVDCEEDTKGKYAQYRFYAYVSSMYHKCELVINEIIPGKTGQHKIPVAVKSNGMYIAIAFKKAVGHPINKKDVIKFYEVCDDVKNGEHGTQLIDAIYGSSVGFRGDALVELENRSKARNQDPERKLEFKNLSENTDYKL